MTASYTYDGDALLRVRTGSVELTQSAEHGDPGVGTLVVDDTAGTTVIVAQKDFAADEDDCSDPVSYRGFIAARSWARGKESVGAGREITVSIEDLNSMLGFRGLTGADANRPAETVAARGAWLMASDYVDGLFVDNGRCDFSSAVGMDAADYTDQFPGDVLADMALAQGGVNHYVRDFGDGPELVFRDDNASTDDTSTIHISNVPGEEDGDTIFYPSRDFALSSRGDRVKSKISYQYSKGRVVEERAATATDFNGERSGVASNSNVKTEAKARDEARAMLWQLHSEEHVLEGSILVPATHANLLSQGDRVGVRLQHLQNLGVTGVTTYYDPDEWVWCRVLEITRKPRLKAASKYELVMRLSPQEPAAPAASIVQSAFFRFGFVTGIMELPNPVTPGNHLVYVAGVRGNSGLPESPNTSSDQPRFGAGAWTRFNGTDPTRTSDAFGVTDDGCAIYWKEADSTEQTCTVLDEYVVCGIFEIAGGDPASASLVAVDAANGAPYTLGSSGTVSAGEVAIGVITIGEAPDEWPAGPWAQVNPPPNMTSDWNVGISQWAFDHYSGSTYLVAHPWTIIASQEGSGSAVEFEVDPGDSTHGFGGLCVVIPSA